MNGTKSGEGYKYTRENGEVETAPDIETVMRLCPVMGKLSLEMAAMAAEMYKDGLARLNPTIEANKSEDTKSSEAENPFSFNIDNLFASIMAPQTSLGVTETKLEAIQQETTELKETAVKAEQPAVQDKIDDSEVPDAKSELKPEAIPKVSLFAVTPVTKLEIKPKREPVVKATIKSEIETAEELPVKKGAKHQEATEPIIVLPEVENTKSADVLLDENESIETTAAEQVVIPEVIPAIVIAPIEIKKVKKQPTIQQIQSPIVLTPIKPVKIPASKPQPVTASKKEIIPNPVAEPFIEKLKAPELNVEVPKKVDTIKIPIAETPKQTAETDLEEIIDILTETKIPKQEEIKKYFVKPSKKLELKTEEDDEEPEAPQAMTILSSASTMPKSNRKISRLIGMFATLLHVEYTPV